MALIGSINVQGELQGQINGARYLTGVITNASAVGGQVVGMRGLQGEKGETGDTGATGADGQDGADGFSPSASVSKVDNVATITITDKDGTTTAEVYDGSGGGASAFIAEYGVTTYADVKDAYDEDAIILCVKDNNGNPLSIMHLTHYNTALHFFVFAVPLDSGWANAILHQDSTWAYSTHDFASTDTATQLRDGLMSALDWQKLDGIASGAEVNVQSDWNEADSTADDYIKNKPTIPSKTSDLNNDVPFATTDTATTLANGLMSSSDKSKLDGIESGAEENYVTKITQHFISNPSDPQEVYPRSATLDYNAVGINDVELLTKDALGEFNGVCDLDASSKVPKSRLPSASTPTADEVSEFDSDAHMNSTDMTTGADSELEDFIDGLNVSGGGEIETPTVTITATTGIVKDVSAVKCGHIFMLAITVYNTSSIAGGSLLFEGSIDQAKYRPLLASTTSGYWGNRAMVSYCRSTGSITVRNVSNSAMSTSSGDPVNVTWTYIIA